jgi:hypothetical protein
MHSFTPIRPRAARFQTRYQHRNLGGPAKYPSTPECRKRIAMGSRSWIASQRGLEFLGVYFRKQPSWRNASKWFCYCWSSQRSMQRIRDKVKAAIGPNNRPALQEKLDRPNQILREGRPTSAGSTQPSIFGRWISISHVETSALVTDETSAPTASALENATGLLERGRPVLESGPLCSNELNAAEGRLPESVEESSRTVR